MVRERRIDIEQERDRRYIKREKGMEIDGDSERNRRIGRREREGWKR